MNGKLPTNVFLLQHVPDGVLETSVLGGVLLDESVDVEHVVPELVLQFDVLFELLVLLLQCGSINATDEATVLLIIINLLTLISELLRYRNALYRRMYRS